VKASEEKRQKL